MRDSTCTSKWPVFIANCTQPVFLLKMLIHVNTSLRDKARQGKTRQLCLKTEKMSCLRKDSNPQHTAYLYVLPPLPSSYSWSSLQPLHGPRNYMPQTTNWHHNMRAASSDAASLTQHHKTCGAMNSINLQHSQERPQGFLGQVTTHICN